MVTQRRVRPSAADHIEELKGLIRTRFPVAEFEISRVGAREYRLRVFGDFHDMDDVLDLTSERATDILVDHDVFIHVLPLGRRISSS
jgi:hypothetical protein